MLALLGALQANLIGAMTYFRCHSFPGLSGANGGKSIAKGQSGLQRPGTGEVVKAQGGFVVLVQVILRRLIFLFCCEREVEAH